MPDMAYAVHTPSCTYLLDDEGICRWTLAPTGVPVPGADRFLGAQFVACLDVREQGGLVGELRVGAAALFARSENGRLVLLRTPLIEYVEHRADDAEASAAALPNEAPTTEPSLPAYAPYTEPLPAYAPRATAAPPAYAAPPPPTAPPYRASTPSAPAYAEPAYSAPAYAEPAYSAPAYAAPAYSAPAYSAPAYAEPAYAAPAYPESAYAAPSTQTLPIPPMHSPSPDPYARSAVSEPEIELEDDDEEELDVEELGTFSEVTLTMPLYRPKAQAPPLPAHRVVIGPGRRLR